MIFILAELDSKGRDGTCDSAPRCATSASAVPISASGIGASVLLNHTDHPCGLCLCVACVSLCAQSGLSPCDLLTLRWGLKRQLDLGR
jgi:hypothetical protein